MNDEVQLVGFDFGTTTMSAVVAEARLTRNRVTGRTDLSELRERFRSDMVFTPITGERIDEAALSAQLDAWLNAGRTDREAIFGGGALLTGLTAQRENAQGLVKLIRQRLGDALIATADDPCLESWLAFMGSCAELSQTRPDLWVLNLDIGGGTTNLALGRAGEVVRTGCLFVGARHVQFVPGTYRLTRLSRYGKAACEHLGITAATGIELTPAQVDTLVTYYLELLTAAVAGARDRLSEPTARLHEQVPFRPMAGAAPLVVTLSGGVGELVYRCLDGEPLPSRTAYGDLGIDLARRLVDSPWSDDLRRFRPASAGRATVYGLLRHNTEISGSTLYLPDASVLPLSDVPILGTVTPTTSDDDLDELLDRAARSAPGACICIEIGSHEASAVSALGNRLAAALRAQQTRSGTRQSSEAAFGDVGSLATSATSQPVLALLCKENVGKVLGQYVSQWGALTTRLLVIDEISLRRARYARIGSPRQQVVPVTFFGLNES